MSEVVHLNTQIYHPTIEKTVLSSAFFNDENFFQITENLSEHDFYEPVNKTVFKTLKQMRSAGIDSADTGTFADYYKPNALGLPGEPDTVANVVGFAPMGTTAIMDRYIPALKQATIRRNLIGVSQEFYRKANEPDSNPEETAIWAQSEIAIVTTQGQQAAKYLFNAQAGLEAAKAARKRPKGTLVTTGVARIDDMTGGLEPGQTLVVGARPGCGKSAFGVQIALDNAKGGRGCLFLSLEMTVEELVDRSISHLAMVDSMDLKRGGLSRNDGEAVDYAENQFINLPILFYDGDPSLDRILTTIRSEHRRHGLSLFVLDFIQRVKTPAIKDRHDLMIGHISRSLTQLAKELRIAGVLLSQFNRTGAESPKLHHLEGGGVIEQDAHKAILLVKKTDDDAPVKEQEIKMILAKNRGGMTGSVPVLFKKHLSMFRELSSHD